MRVTEILRIPLRALDRVLLLGPPGIGKTEVVYQKAKMEAEKRNKAFLDLKKANIKELEDAIQNPEKYFIYLRVIATHVFPEDVSMPRDAGEYVVFKSPLTLKILEKCEGVLFIDELTNLKRADQRCLFYSIIQEKEAGWNLRFSDDLVIVAAGNLPEHSSDAVELSKALENRLTMIRCDPPTVDEWIAYMRRRYGGEWEKFCAVYLLRYPEDLFRLNEEPFEAFPSPRSWTKTALQLKMIGISNADLVEAFVSGNLGGDVASKFMALLRVNIPHPREFLEKYEQYWRSFSGDQKFLMIYSLAQYLHSSFDDAVDGFVDFAVMLLEGEERDMAVLMLRLLEQDILMKLLERDAFSAAVDKYVETLSDILL